MSSAFSPTLNNTSSQQHFNAKLLADQSHSTMAYGNKGLGQSGLPATASTHEATVVPGDYALEVKLRAASSESKPSQQTRQYGSS